MEKVECECGKLVKYNTLDKHKTSIFHQRFCIIRNNLLAIVDNYCTPDIPEKVKDQLKEDVSVLILTMKIYQ